MKELTRCFPDGLQRERARATGNLDETSFLFGFDREVKVEAERGVPQGCPLLVTGWALDPDGRGGAAEVMVTIDGTLAVKAATRLRRSDVARSLRNADLETVGFLARLPTHELALGKHSINFHVLDRARGVYYSWYENYTFEVGMPAEGLARPAPGRMTFSVGAVRTESGAGAGTSPGTIAEYSVALVEGWVVDAKFPAVAGDVSVLVDQRTVNRGLYGFACDDAVERFGTSAVRESGFKVRFATRALQPGLHTFHIIAVSADGSVYDESEEHIFEIAAVPDPPMQGTLTAQTTSARFEKAYALAAGGGTTAYPIPVRIQAGEDLHLSGWAVDEPRGSSGFDAALLVDESTLFAAFYGAPRPDIAAAFGSDTFLNSGFVGAIDTADLAPGRHTVRCLVRSADSTLWLRGSELMEFEVSRRAG